MARALESFDDVEVGDLLAYQSVGKPNTRFVIDIDSRKAICENGIVTIMWDPRAYVIISRVRDIDDDDSRD